MASVTHLGDQGFTTNVAAYTTTTGWTPAVGDHLIVFVSLTASVSAAPTLAESAGGGTYTLVGRAVKATSADALYCFVRDTLCESTASRNFTFTSSPSDAATTCIFSMEKTTGMIRAGTSSIRQFDPTDNGAAAGTPNTVFAGVALTGNPCIGAVANGATPAAITPPGGTFSELADVGQSTPAAGLETAKSDSGHTSATITWGGTSATAWCAFSVELDTTAPTQFPPPILVMGRRA
jgi:hypothetical protein